jgi:hypothetical protein
MTVLRRLPFGAFACSSRVPNRRAGFQAFDELANFESPEHPYSYGFFGRSSNGPTGRALAWMHPVTACPVPSVKPK